MKAIWFSTLAWLAAVTAALVLAFAAPSESSVMGRVPSMSAKRLDQQPISLPEGLPAGRTLALVAFTRSHRGEVDSWIQGLQLNQNSSITWLKMPVLNDPGTDRARSDIENRLLARHTSDADRARLVPVFTDRDAFIRAAGLSGTEHMGVLVLDRGGQVLARVEGQFDQDKALAIRETLLAQNAITVP
ncbi:MAG: hypothetical protein HYX47_05220 [Burkholderiales bacterium]|nr:hypothetical protein [Burkholderiales bacterium]